MAIRNIITGKDNSALRKKAREVKNINKRTSNLMRLAKININWKADL